MTDKTIEEKIVELKEKHKEQARRIADSADYDPTNMTRNIENPLIRSLVFQHIDTVRELTDLITQLKELNKKITMTPAEKELRDCVEYCRQQNGIDECKNCSLNDEKITTLIEAIRKEEYERIINFIKINWQTHLGGNAIISADELLLYLTDLTHELLSTKQ